jgi:hypothetical protein
MYRLANGTQVPALPAVPAPVGTPGYGTNGDPGAGLLGSIFGAAEFNVLQEELMSFLLAAGITPDQGNYGQVLAACLTLFARAASIASVVTEAGMSVDHGNPDQFRDALRILYGGGGGGGDEEDHWQFPGGKFVMFGNFGGTTGPLIDGVAENAAIAVSFPIAFPTACHHVYPVAFDVTGACLAEGAWRVGTPTASGCTLGLRCKQASTAMSGSYLAIGK